MPLFGLRAEKPCLLFISVFICFEKVGLILDVLNRSIVGILKKSYFAKVGEVRMRSRPEARNGNRDK